MIPKFRVWDKKRSEMINLIAINFHKYIPMDDLTCSCSDGPITRNFQDVVLMQSTGLHDNTKFEDLSNEEQEEWLESGKSADEWKGREIFQGDIVKVIGDYDNDICVVRFESGAFVLDYKNLDTEFDLIYSVSLPIKVIGNVWENEGLLNDC